MEEKDKQIDESWKESAQKEKEALSNAGQEPPAEKADFNFFITTLAIQAAICLGQLDNPVTNKKEQNLPQAKFIIDTIDLLKEKTKGNLTKEETTLLENILYELKLQYVDKNKEAKP